MIVLITFTTASAQPWIPYMDAKADASNFNNIKAAFDAYATDLGTPYPPGHKHFRRQEWVVEHHAYPDGKINPPVHYYKEKQKFLQQTSSKNTHNGTWIPLGINSWTVGFSGYSPGNGRINSATVDPNDSATIYVASASGGVWKTTDHGQTWNTTYDQMPVLGVSSIAVNPSNSQELFVGTGDRDANDTPGIGIYKSTDGGATWQTTALTTGHRFNKIIYNPQNHKSMLAAMNSGIYQSYNGGISWTKCFTGPTIRDIDYKPGDTSIVYAIGNTFYRSTNGGQQFSQVSSGLSGSYRKEMAVSPATPDLVYIVSTNSSNSFGGLYLSTNSGQSFSLQSSSPNILGYEADGSDNKGQGWYDLAIAANPTKAGEIYVGGVNVWRSLDSGSIWMPVSHWIYNTSGGYLAYTHADIHFLDFFGDDFYCGSDGGLFHSDDDGIHWTDLSAGMGISQFYKLGICDSDPSLMVAGAQDNGSNKYTNGNWKQIFGADGMEGDIMAGITDVIYVSSQYGGMRRSEDAGLTFTYIRPDSVGGGWVTPYLLHPSDQWIIIAGYKAVWYSDDAGYNWTDVSGHLFGGSNIRNLESAPSDPGYIYASYGNKLAFTDDGGIKWLYSYPDVVMSITGITVDEADPKRLWVTVANSGGNKVLYSDNGGYTFSDISDNLTHMGLNCIIKEKGPGDKLYVGTETGIVYRDSTTNGWVDFGDGLPNVRVRELEINYQDHIIRAATYGRGIWESYLYGTAQNIEEENISHAISIYPNPAEEEVFVQLEQGMQVERLDLFNVAGRHVRSLPYTGRNTIKIDRDNLPEGMYFIRIQTDQQVIVERMIFE